MKKLLLFIFFCLFAHGFSQNKSPISPNIKKFKNDTIVWRKDSLLKKEDFKAKGKSNGPLGFTASAIFLYPSESGGQIIFNVEALFLKSKSYVTKYSEYVLNHEQMHFNITEIYARKLRQKLSEKNFAKVKDMKSVIQAMYSKNENDYVREQEKFDRETEHGLNAAKQNIWNENIMAALLQLEAFSNTQVSMVK
jgi:hypothetical protein